MADPLAIPVERLASRLDEAYGVAPTRLERLDRGKDVTAAVYRVEDGRGSSYLLKVRSTHLHEASCLVPRALANHGIAAAVAPIPARGSGLWTHLGADDSPTLTLYPFVDGDVGWQPSMAAAQWQAVGRVFRRIHAQDLPEEIAGMMRRERFDTGVYLRWVGWVEVEHVNADGGSEIDRAMRERWREHQATFHTLLDAMETLAPALRHGAGPFVVCHADLHPSNIIRSRQGAVFVIDWDDVMLAPKERDFLFVGDPPSAAADDFGDAAPFFQGYGAGAIDWSALTYFRCERVVTDAIESARQVFASLDLSESTKAEAVDRMGAIFAPGNRMIEAALAAAAHLPPGQQIVSPVQ